MYHRIPREACVVDYDVYLPFPELRRFRNQCVDMSCVEHVSSYCDGLSSGFIDALGD